MRIMYAVCSWGYGHVTRSLPIIRRFIKEGHEVVCVATGQPRYMLEQELGHFDNQVEIVDVKDYPLPYTQNPDAFFFKFLATSPTMLIRIQKENDWVAKDTARRKYDLIVSDNRYGIYNKRVPSFLMTHQLRMLAPGRVRFMEWGTEKFVSFFQDYFTKFIVPDFEEDDLCGDLCHNLTQYKKGKIAYIGVISDFPYDPTMEKDLDGYISISGPEPQRTSYERTLRKQVGELKGKWIMSLGKKKAPVERIGNVKVVPYLTTKDRAETLSRTDFVITRSGYTTLMDICMGGHKALLSPTPGQTEQEYLSAIHNKKGTWYSVDQDKIDLLEGIKKAKKFTGIKRGSTEKAVEKAMDTFFG